MQKIIAIAFDFDDTLAPDTTSGFLKTLGINVSRFWSADVRRLLEAGWDPTPAYMAAMIFLARRDPRHRITKERLAAWGRRVRPYPGVGGMFGRIRRHVASVDPSVSVEFYAISSGLGDVIHNAPISKQFTRIWTSNFSYARDGSAEFARNVISFTDKTRYLFHITKGLITPQSDKDPFAVNRKIPENKARISFQNMIYVGDGYTDIPCFSLVRKNGGTAIGVFDRGRRDKWRRAWSYVEDGRVSNLVPVDYRPNSALLLSLQMAVETIAHRIRLTAHTYQG